MLGIDIVDLHDPKLKERDERSLRLINHPSDSIIDHDQIYWLLWSAKEAVFKCLREANNFSPTSIPIIIHELNNEITFTSNDLRGSVFITKDYILAICSDDLSAVKYETIETPGLVDSDTLRADIKNFFEKFNIQLGSDDLNLPILLPSSAPISISHHGNYGAFIYPTEILNN